MKILFILLLFLGTLLKAEETCDDCEPLAEVAITNHGLEKLISISLDENLKQIDTEISKRAGFRPLIVDRSHCKTQTISEVFNSQSKENCYGLPDLSDIDGIGAKTELRPYRAEINNWKLNKVDLSLAKPVKCVNFVCDFEIKANEISVSGDLGVKYTDRDETFIPPTKLTVKTTENSDLKMKGQVLIDPKTGKLTDLIFLNENSLKIDVAKGSMALDMDFKREFKNKEDEMRILTRNFHRYVPISKINDEYLEKQYQNMRFKLEIDEERDIQAKRKSEGQSELPWQKSRELASKEVDKMIIEKYGSISNFKQKLKSIKWPSRDNEQETYDFIQNPPPELIVFDEIKDRIQYAEVAAVAENAGYNNPNAFIMTVFAVQTANKAANDNFMIDNFIQPMIEKEVLPIVKAEVNAELRNLREYWNQISKIPNLNAQNLQILSDLQDKLEKTKDEKEKTQLREKIAALKKKMESDWVSIDTEVAIEKNNRDSQLLRAQITKSNQACNDYPKKFSDDQDTDFDIRSQFGVNTLQEYFNRMSKNNNLDICVDSSDPATCKDGKKVRLNKPPKIGCDNGEFTFDLDAEAATKILGIPIEAAIGAKIKAKINNCSGSPCIQFTDSKGNFKNVFINTFFGGMLDRGLSSTLTKTNNIPVNVPHAKLKKSQSNSKDCKTKLDWNLEQ